MVFTLHNESHMQLIAQWTAIGKCNIVNKKLQIMVCCSHISSPLKANDVATETLLKSTAMEGKT